MDQADALSDTTETVHISLPWTWQPVKRRMLPGCEFFREGDVAMRIARKLIPLENDPSDSKDEADDVVKDTIPCNALGCKQTFTSLLSYENHYKSAHQHTCMTCHRAFPSEHLLDVHIQENHDPLFAILAERQSMYRCLVEGCGDKFPNPDARRQHMIKVHCYPANFRFHRLKPADPKPKHRKKPARSGKTASDMDVDKPSPPQSSQENAPQMTHASPTPAASHTSASPMESPSDKENAAAAAEGNQGTDGKGEEEEEGGMEVSETEKPAPRRVFVHKVPQNFSFGHGVSRGFQRPPGKKKSKKKGAHWHQRAKDNLGETTTNIENVDMTDMADALSDAL